MFNTSWNVDKYRNEHESDEHWKLRKQFMAAHKNKFPEPRLVCLTQVFFNMEFLGCRYPDKTMALVNQLAAEVAEEFREARKDKLKRTFVGAQDAAGAKAKGAKPPPGAIEGSQHKQLPQLVDSSPPKKPRLAQDEMSVETVGQSMDANNFWPLEKDSKPVINEQMDKMDTIDDTDWSAALKEVAKQFILMIPPRANSKTEGDPVCIMHHNFPGNKVSFHHQGSKNEGGWTCVVKVNPSPDPDNSDKPSYTIASCFGKTQREGKKQASAIAIENLKKYCTYIEPNHDWFQEGGTPDFIKHRIPCKKNPRNYIIMTKKETGHITTEVADMLLKNFKISSNDDVFFPDSEYNEYEKIQLMNRSQNHDLGFRHFGSNTMLKDHHVCIYKKKPAAEIVEEARKLNWKHPKYLVKLKNIKN